ncbi:acyl-CoA thioesterase [Salinimicrobium oceani]|uniref:Acyl-CoA thioesterase n=1 Tax=Salinimicrobium oceani TaxID=2722702 RepID=A0ABX1D2B6_9FLAO|nr:acyl-CoA thioesterase [Salinimicrobium oceani]NJW52996.1 acyl-CoA thioesterase [Salinimicrobium oceani]
MDLSEYKLSLDLRIDFSDLDMYRHVNNLTFIRFLQSGRVNFWEATGLAKMFSESNKGAILVSTHCDFKKSLFYPGTATVKTKLAYIRNSSFALDQLILNDKGEICAEGRDIAVFFDFTHDKSLPLPLELKEVMQQY